MVSKSPLVRVLLGLASGIIGGLPCLVLAYLVGVVAIALSFHELLPTLLAAVTVLPLMLIIVGVPVTFVLGLITGGLLGIGAALRNGPFGLLLGVVAGVVCAELLISVCLPLIAPPQRGDFIHIVASPYVSAIYGALLGLSTTVIFRWLDRKGG
jgi:hypothetical protein